MHQLKLPKKLNEKPRTGGSAVPVPKSDVVTAELPMQGPQGHKAARQPPSPHDDRDARRQPRPQFTDYGRRAAGRRRTRRGSAS